MTTRHERRPPGLAALLGELDRRGLDVIVTGSVAALVHGVALEPGDLDVVPREDIDNLERLADLLVEIEATPFAFGHWTRDEQGERRWVEEQTTPERLAAWRPDPHDIATFDHLYVTRLGDFDVVPELTGTYADLDARALAVGFDGSLVRVPPIGDLLEGLTVPRRPKDVDRVRALRAIQRERGGGREPGAGVLVRPPG